jgi:phosphate transport system permease protein
MGHGRLVDHGGCDQNARWGAEPGAIDGNTMTAPNQAGAASGEVVAAPFREPPPTPTLPWGNGKPGLGDRLFRGLSAASGVLIIALIGGIGLFLLWRAIPALGRDKENFFTYGGNWVTTNTSALHFGIADLLQVTVFVALFALVLAMPIALGIAIFLTQYAPRRIAGPLAYMVDLLAAVPSIIYGVWGLYVLAPRLSPIATWLNEHLGWVFLFATGNATVSGGGTIFTAGIVLAVMILPIISAVTREVFLQTPRSHIEAALALGATQWEMIKITVLPFGRSGYISGAMLGLGRALGETIALLIIMRGTRAEFGWSLFDGGYTFATKIAATASEFNNEYKAGAYIAAGLMLFLLTLVVNALARAAVAGRGNR